MSAREQWAHAFRSVRRVNNLQTVPALVPFGFDLFKWHVAHTPLFAQAVEALQ